MASYAVTSLWDVIQEVTTVLPSATHPVTSLGGNACFGSRSSLELLTGEVGHYFKGDLSLIP